MPPKRIPPELRALQRKQLDSQLGSHAQLRGLKPPKNGWVRAVRTALGMTTAQLARRLGITAQGVADLERREASESITLGSLRKAADAMNCDLLVALVPRTSLEQTVREQAQAKAADERDRVIHTMRLEAQQSGVSETLDPTKDIQGWLTERIRQLWD